VISDSPPTEPQGELATSSAADEGGKKPWWKMMATPIVLVLLGLAVLPVALLLYPSPTDTSAPTYSRISVLSNQRILFIDYAVVQVKPALAKILVEVVRPENVPVPAPGAPALYANLVVGPPVGTSFLTCPSAPPPYGCTRLANSLLPAFTWEVALTFNAHGQAFDNFFVKATNLGVSDNGVNALAALPEVFYQGTSAPEILAGYHIPSAASYDWSALPPAAFIGSTIAWTEPIAGYDTPSKVAVGVNQSRQSSDNHLAFIAGALIGVAGGAVLSGVQEGLGRIFK
jgi:hypothetical protein